MDNRKVIVGVLSATTAVVALPASTSAATAPDSFTLSVDSFGRLALDDQDVGAYLTQDQQELGDMYAGNNCDCTNQKSCNPPPSDPPPVVPILV
jgi:hypothetical protein